MDTERPDGVPSHSVQSTGDPRVDEAIGRLDRLRDQPLDEHPAALESVHDRLREILGELGDAGGPRPARPGEQRPGEPRPGEPGRRGEQGQLGR